ncbi:crossover junction endodeoxyribonuclease RuvC [Candidatus Bipolaricaulota bacterium]|nr:crossover junction endodeoxyribonuclease RuvC [Candidatus Bipolaricaulota bacterium]
MTRSVVALGLDPGLATTGYGIVVREGRKLQVLAGGVLTTGKEMLRSVRLKMLHDEVCELVKTYQPGGVAIEEVFFATNSKTAMVTAETRGALLTAVCGLPIRGYTPLQVKKRIAGYGRANKAQVQAMVKQQLGLRELPRPDDMADGLALALCFLRDDDLLRGGVRNDACQL